MNAFSSLSLTLQVVQHSSLLEHSGNVTALSLTGKDTLISGSRDRSTVNLVAGGNYNEYDGAKTNVMKILIFSSFQDSQYSPVYWEEKT